MNKHLLNIGLNTIRMFIVPIAIFSISFVVIQSSGKELWGDFVKDYLLINLAAMLLLFGSKEQLIRSYSATPKKIEFLFFESLSTRGTLLLPIIFIFWFTSSGTYEWLLISSSALGLYLYQSAESLIIYHKRFLIQILAEIIALICIIGILLIGSSIDVEKVLIAYTAGIWIKVIIILFTVFPKPQVIQPNFRHFVALSPFFIIGLSGLLQSRVDQYIIAGYCDDTTISTYQLFLSVFIMIQSLSAAIYVTYNKHVYRVNISVFKKVNRTISFLGIFIVSFLGMIAYLIFPLLFTIELSPYYFIMGGIFALPCFVYGPIIFLFYRVKREREVMWVNYISAVINLVLTFFFVLKGNPLNAIIGSAISQWIILSWYLYRQKAIIHEIEMS